MNPRQQQINTLHRAAQKAVGEGQLREAHQHCLAILKLDQEFADAWFLCGVIAAHNGRVSQAVAILHKAIGLAPGNAEYLAELGKQLVALRQPKQALLTAQQAYGLKPSSLPTLNTLGTVFSHCGEHETALACFAQAAHGLNTRSSSADKLPADWRADLYFNYGASLQFSGQFQAAEDAYEKAIALLPQMYKTHSALSHLRRQTAQSNHLARLQSLRAGISGPQDQLHLGHAIAKEQEDLEQFSESLASLAWAKQGQAQRVGHTAEKDAVLFAAIRALFTPEFVASQGAFCDSPEPIFIVGMPRTGTTLVEQILSSHSQVYAAGELQDFPLQVKRMTDSPSADVVDVETFTRSVELDMATLGASYIDGTRPRTGHTTHFIDKLPLNFMYLGLIKRALPNARLICLRRDPMDTCLSNYRQLFATNFKYYHYNYDLLDCGRYYIEFDRLMRHWRETLQGSLLELQYEALVKDPEQHTKRLLAHCGLPWEDQCLSFHRQKSSVATASAVQVRQGVYTSSVNRWQRYGDAMQPLYEMLESAGCYS
ncbi:MAG: sulfotransferase [Halioglobus sp.]|nr:sulfotransferase [Halioglobus sp.]